MSRRYSIGFDLKSKRGLCFISRDDKDIRTIIREAEDIIAFTGPLDWKSLTCPDGDLLIVDESNIVKKCTVVAGAKQR